MGLSRRTIALGAVVVIGLAAGGAVAQGTETFSSVMATAMGRMDKDMMMPSSGNPDRDFAAMMIPHHQGAIDMAEAELRFGKDPVLRKLAREIIAAQKKEIAIMKAQLARLPAGVPSSEPMPGMRH